MFDVSYTILSDLLLTMYTRELIIVAFSVAGTGVRVDGFITPGCG